MHCSDNGHPKSVWSTSNIQEHSIPCWAEMNGNGKTHDTLASASNHPQDGPISVNISEEISMGSYQKLFKETASVENSACSEPESKNDHRNEKELTKSEWVGWVRPQKPPENQKISGWEKGKIQVIDTIKIKVDPPPSEPAYLTPKNQTKKVPKQCGDQNSSQNLQSKGLIQSLNSLDKSSHNQINENRQQQDIPQIQQGTSTEEVAMLRKQNASLKRRLHSMERRLVEGMQRQLKTVQGALQQKDMMKSKLQQLHETVLKAEGTKKSLTLEKAKLQKQLDEAKQEESANANRFRTLIERLDILEESIEKKEDEIEYLQNELSAHGVWLSAGYFRSSVLPPSIPEGDEGEEESSDEEDKEERTSIPQVDGHHVGDSNDKNGEEGNESEGSDAKESEGKIENNGLVHSSSSEDFTKVQDEKVVLEHSIEELWQLLEEQKATFQKAAKDSDEQVRQLEEVVESQLKQIELQEKESCEGITYLTGLIEKLHNKITQIRLENEELKKICKDQTNLSENETTPVQSESLPNSLPESLHDSLPANLVQSIAKDMPEFHDPWFQTSS